MNKKPKDILTKKFLEEEYVKNRKSCLTIAKENNIKSVNSVEQAIKKHGLRRSSKRDTSHITKEFLKEYYVRQNLTLKEVAQISGFQRKAVISRLLKKYNIPQREKTYSDKFKDSCLKRRIHSDIPSRYIHSIIRSAKNRNIEYSVSLDYLWEAFRKQDRKCAISGVYIDFPKVGQKQTEQTASIDRIDSDLGYIEGNIWWVHKKINTMKWDLKLKEFLEICKIVSENNR